jgi:hypothetical protein
MCNHIVAIHPDVAKVCLPYVCFACSTSYKTEQALAKHKAASCKKRRASSELADAAKRIQMNTKCCGYSFSNRLWNYDRHRATRHGVGMLCTVHDLTDALQVVASICVLGQVATKGSIVWITERRMWTKFISMLTTANSTQRVLCGMTISFCMLVAKEYAETVRVPHTQCCCEIVSAGGHAHVGIVCAPDEV